MKNLILFDDDGWKSLLPLTYTRPIADIRIGILTIREKWEKHLEAKGSYITQDYLSEKYPINIEAENWVINARLLPNEKIIHLISQLTNNEALLYNDVMIAARLDEKQFKRLIEDESVNELVGVDLSNEQNLVDLIERPHHIFQNNADQLALDFELLTKDRNSIHISETNKVTNPSQIFLEEGAQVEHCYLDASKGPIYVAKHAKIMQGAMVMGGLALNEHATIKMGAKIYGATTVGPHSKLGGEVSNSVLIGYSNKGHDGYLGNSVLGEWCNIGADSNNSNLKNNYAEVKLWDYVSERFEPTGVQFCGLIMGDHSKCGINTMFNTGTVVGVNCNIFGSGFPRNFVPSFAWGGASGFSTFQIKKAFEVDSKVMERRDKRFDDVDQRILEHVFHTTAYYRSWEK